MKTGEGKTLVATLPLKAENQCERIKVLSLAPLLASAIINIHTGQSVGDLFR
jgi:phosphoribosylpyrophosphate synthetase